MQSAQWPDASNGDGYLLGHSADDALVDEDPPAGHVANVDERRPLVSLLAPTQPHLTNVTAAATAAIFVSNNEGIPAWMLVQPAARLVIKYDYERFAHQQAADSVPDWLSQNPRDQDGEATEEEQNNEGHDQ